MSHAVGTNAPPGGENGTTHAEDRRAFFTLLGIVGGLVVLVIGGILLVRAVWVPVREVARFELDEEARSVDIQVEEGERLEVWTDLRIEHRNISYQKPNSKLPRTMDYLLEIQQDGVPVWSRRCNPLNSNVARTSYYGASGGVSGREYDGRINDCNLALDPGSYTLVARRERVGQPRGIRWMRTVLILRARPSA